MTKNPDGPDAGALRAEQHELQGAAWKRGVPAARRKKLGVLVSWPKWAGAADPIVERGLETAAMREAREEKEARQRDKAGVEIVPAANPWSHDADANDDDDDALPPELTAALADVVHDLMVDSMELAVASSLVIFTHHWRHHEERDETPPHQLIADLIGFRDEDDDDLTGVIMALANTPVETMVDCYRAVKAFETRHLMGECLPAFARLAHARGLPVGAALKDLYVGEAPELFASMIREAEDDI